MSETKHISLSFIRANPYQARLAEDAAAIAELAASIERDSLLQVPTGREVFVEKTGQSFVELAFGHSRLAAFRLLNEQGKPGFDVMPVIIRELTDEQMFTFGVQENIRRRNLNPIEQATAMKRYMEEFHKTSEQAGELFGVSAETVRGNVRLLGLPAEIQEKVSSGEITVGAARKLLTVQAISPAAAIKAATNIVKQADPTPQEIEEELESAIEHREGVIRMWTRYGGEPRGGADLWPLPWQHKGSLFPLTEDEIKALVAGPAAEPIKGKRKKQSAAAPSQLDTAAIFQQLAGGMRLSADLFPGSEDKIDLLNQLADPPACIACGWYGRFNQEHFCTLQACWERKKAAWLLKEQLRFCEELGIRLYDPERGDPQPRAEWRQDWGENHERFKALLKKKDPGLRLVPDEKGNYGSWPGTESKYFRIVDVEKREKPEKQKAQSAKHTAAELKAKADAEREANKRAQEGRKIDLCKHYLSEVAVPVFAKAFAGIKSVALLEHLVCKVLGTNDVLYELDLEYQEKPFKKLPAGQRLPYLQVRLAGEALGELFDLDWVRQDSILRKGPAAVAKGLQKTAAEWGVKLPKDWLDVAKEWDAKDPAELEEDGA